MPDKEYGRPLAGAWIEITAIGAAISDTDGRPLAGAWIEMILETFSWKVNTVAPSRGRGLKYLIHIIRMDHFGRPLAGAWIEIPGLYFPALHRSSLHSRNRGFKYRAFS